MEITDSFMQLPRSVYFCLFGHLQQGRLSQRSCWELRALDAVQQRNRKINAIQQCCHWESWRAITNIIKLRIKTVLVLSGNLETALNLEWWKLTGDHRIPNRFRGMKVLRNNFACSSNKILVLIRCPILANITRGWRGTKLLIDSYMIIVASNFEIKEIQEENNGTINTTFPLKR